MQGNCWSFIRPLLAELHVSCARKFPYQHVQVGAISSAKECIKRSVTLCENLIHAIDVVRLMDVGNGTLSEHHAKRSHDRPPVTRIINMKLQGFGNLLKQPKGTTLAHTRVVLGSYGGFPKLGLPFWGSQ